MGNGNKGPLHLLPNPSAWQLTLKQWVLEKGDMLLLRLWLQGMGFPHLSDDEPWFRIVEGLPSHYKNSEFETKLARRLAELLNANVESEKPRRTANRITYNLLRLCAATERPEILDAPLRAMLNRRKLARDLRVDLAEALARNQGRLASGLEDLRPLWKGILQGKERWLYASPRDGMEGIIRFKDSRGKPDEKTISWGLGEYARFLEHAESKKSNRQTYFKYVLNSVGRICGWGGITTDELPSWAAALVWSPCERAVSISRMEMKTASRKLRAEFTMAVAALERRHARPDPNWRHYDHADLIEISQEHPGPVEDLLSSVRSEYMDDANVAHAKSTTG